MVCILSKGLLVSPIESQSSVSRFESWIYLSVSFKKCLSYLSYAYGGDKLYIFLVDVFLDKVFKISKNNKFDYSLDMDSENAICGPKLVNIKYYEPRNKLPSYIRAKITFRIGSYF